MHQNASLASHTYVKNENSVLSLRLSEIGWLLLFNALAFQIYFQEEFGGLTSYIDELATLIVLAAIVIPTVDKTRRSGGKMPIVSVGLPILLLVAALVLGLASNNVSAIRDNAYPILVDAFTFCKVPIIFLCSLVAFQNSDAGSNAIWKLLIKESHILLVIMLACAVINLISGGNLLDMGGEIRYGISSFYFIFYHPEVVNLLVIGLMVILLFDNPEGHKKYILAALLVMCATMRWKAIGFAALAVYMFLLKGKSGLSLLKFVFALVIVVLVAWGQISTYYDTDSTARSMLTSDSFDVAVRFAPFGSGFGTFASAVTADVEYYSPLYYQYGYDTVYGLSPMSTSYISDTFWPTIIAQLGFIGAACYTASVALLLWQLYKQGKRIGAGLAISFLVFYLAISSTSASALFAPQWVFIGLVVFLSLRFCPRAKSLQADSVYMPKSNL